MTLPTLRPVTSSVLTAIAYAPLVGQHRSDGADGFLIVRLKSGATWAYAVPSWIVGLLSNPRISAGRFYNAHIKGRPALKVAA